MRIFGPSGVRNFPTDRSPLTIAVAASATTTADAVATLATYTVPAGRRADLAVQAGSVITTVLAAAQIADVRIRVTPSGGAAQLVYVGNYQAAAAVGTVRETPSIHLQLRAGDLVEVQIFAAAGAGVILGSGGVQGIEYGA